MVHTHQDIVTKMMLVERLESIALSIGLISPTSNNVQLCRPNMEPTPFLRTVSNVGLNLYKI